MASRGLNKVMLIGNLGNEPEVRYTQSGGAVVNLSIATNEVWRDRETGSQQERTEWHRVVLFGKLAEIARDYLHKGSKIYLEGRLQTRKWQDNNGQDRYTTEIVGNEMQMLDSRGSGGEFANAPPPSGENPAPAGSPSRPAPPDNATDDFDDDIPF